MKNEGNRVEELSRFMTGKSSYKKYKVKQYLSIYHDLDYNTYPKYGNTGADRQTDRQTDHSTSRVLNW